MIQLRPYQNAMIDGVRERLRRGSSRVVLQAGHPRPSRRNE